MDAKPSSSSDPAAAPAERAPDPFVRNLVFLLALGVAISGWLLAYTDWFSNVSAVLALGGLFTWAGVVSKLLSAPRTAELQAWVDRAVFSNRTLALRLIVLATVLMALASFAGTVEVQSQGDPSSRLLWFGFVPGHFEGAERLESGARVRAPWATSWWSPAHVRVKVSGYPSLLATVNPWQRVRLVSPSSFLMTPVILLVPTSRLAQFSRDTKLVVSVDGLPTGSIRFDSHSVWIGCEDDVRVPEAIVNEWRATTPMAEMVSAWQTPRAVNADLKPGSTVTISIEHEDGTPFVTPPPIKVRAPVRPEDFPQREIIDVPQ